MSDVKERLRGPYDYTADGQSLFVPERDIEDALAEIARLEARVADQEQHISALQERVHLCAGYDKLVERVKELEAEAAMLKAAHDYCLPFLASHGWDWKGWREEYDAALDRKEGE